MADITFAYPFDPTGRAASNKIVSERQTLIPPAWKDFYFIVPKLAPYFADSLEVWILPSGKKLVEGVDYVHTHLFHDASLACGRPIYGSITFYDKTLKGVVELNYQTLGGEWTVDESTANEILINNAVNPRVTTWEQVVEVPDRFPVVDHEWHLDDMVGMEEVRSAIMSIATALGETEEGQYAEHMADIDNPHQTTKTHVGLGKVENLPVASRAQAVDGSLNSAYMTPLRTREAIEALAGNTITGHAGNLNNPHQTTKAQVGLGDVEDLPLSTKTQAEEGDTHQAYMTPLRTKEAIGYQTKSLVDHTQARNNPHNTTAHQVGATTEDDVRTLIQQTLSGNIIASDSEKFGGLYPNEWGASFIDINQLDNVVASIRDEFEAGQLGLSSVSIPEVPSLPPLAGLTSLSAAGGRYYGLLTTGGALEVPNTDLIDDSRVDLLMVRAVEDGAYVLAGDNTLEAFHPAGVTTVYDPPAGLTDVVYVDVGRHVFAMKSDDTVVAFGDPSTASLRAIDPTDNADVYMVATGDTNNAVMLHGDGHMTPLGTSNFKTNIQPILDSYTGFPYAVVLSDHYFGVVNTDGDVRLWEITDATGAATFSEVTLGAEFTGIAGINCWSTHVVMRRNDGSLLGYGSNDRGQLDIPEIPVPIERVVTGDGFTVALTVEGFLVVWGDTRGGALNPPSEYQN